MTVPLSGSAQAFTLSEFPDPVPGPGEVLIEVAAAGVNRADVAQRQGTYASAPGWPEWPGLEVSGTIAAVAGQVGDWRVGDRVCALLGGGGYADLVVVPTTHLLRVPESVDLVDAAGLPETVCTVWSNVFMTAGLKAGETLLVHGGGSGIGTTAIQLARALGSLVAVTAGSQRKLDVCRELGAEILINYPEQDYVTELLRATDGRGADVILDHIGGDYLDRDLQALAPHGRIIMIGNQSGQQATISIGRLMRKWATIHGSTLRARSDEEKSEIVASVAANVWPLVENGQVTPVIDERIPLTEVARAHEKLEASEHVGKILLVP